MGLAGKIPVFVAAVLMACTVAHAQTDRREVRKGNRDFKKEEYKEAEIDYRKALVKDSTSLAAVYNLGNTLYRNGDMEQAVSTYGKLKDAAAASEYGASYYYNMGNAAASMEDWQSAVDAYAKSLLMNPGDMDAKEIRTRTVRIMTRIRTTIRITTRTISRTGMTVRTSQAADSSLR